MPRTKRQDQVEQAIENAVVTEEIVPVDNHSLAPQGDSPPEPPVPTDPKWQDYVLSHFDKSELDQDGNPTAEACRIVVERILGTIVSESVRTLQVPTPENDYRATVEVSVAIAWGHDPGDIRTFEDVADVYPGNMDPKFAQFPTASAKTKAMGRAYKSALKLRKVYTTEELASKEVPLPGAGFKKLISFAQQKFVEKLCRELKIDAKAFINLGQLQYEDISQVASATAEKMIKKLNEYQQNTDGIPDKIRVKDPMNGESK